MTELIKIDAISAANEPNTNQTETKPNVSISIMVNINVIQNQIIVADPKKMFGILFIREHLLLS